MAGDIATLPGPSKSQEKAMDAWLNDIARLITVDPQELIDTRMAMLALARLDAELKRYLDTIPPPDSDADSQSKSPRRKTVK